MTKKYIVRLSDEERQELGEIIRRGKAIAAGEETNQNGR